MTPTTPEPADGDALKARDAIRRVNLFALRIDPYKYGLPEGIPEKMDEMSEIVAAALRLARQDGARAQMERDCAAVCNCCASPSTYTPSKYQNGMGLIHTRINGNQSWLCDAAAIRAAWDNEQ